MRAYHSGNFSIFNMVIFIKREREEAANIVDAKGWCLKVIDDKIPLNF